MNKDEIRQELIETLEGVNRQIEYLKKDFKNRMGNDVDPYTVMNKLGEYMLTPLLVAKANLLNALVTLGGQS